MMSAPDGHVPKGPASGRSVAAPVAPPLRTPAAIRARAICAACAAGIALSGCFFYPRETATYNPQCQNPGTSLRLESGELGNFCHWGANTEASACIAAALAVTAASAVVSGTIVAVGNSFYWLEERAKCVWQPRRHDPAPDRVSIAGIAPAEASLVAGDRPAVGESVSGP